MIFLGNEFALKHGHSRKKYKSPTYYSWNAMKTRCRKGYAKHLGFDQTWDKFENFLRDMGERPEGTTLDRIDGTKGYSKENCRWATYTEQTRNRNRTRRYSYAGEFLTAAEFAEKYHLSYSCTKNRLDRGQPLERAVGRWL